MKYLRLRSFKTALKTLLGISAVGLLCMFMLSMKARKFNDALWKQLGLTQPDANRNIFASFRDGQFLYFGAKHAKNIATGNRVAIVNELGAYAKKYAVSEEFKREYLAYRARKKPSDPYQIELTADMVKAQEKERIEKGIKTMEANANSPNEKLRNSVPGRIEALKKELAALDDPNNRVIKQKLDYVARSNEQAVKLYDQAIKKWEAEYPENPQPLIKKRLQQILDITADVDYEAELTDARGKKVFVNPVYEKKPAEWKLAFRSGKAATEAVRAFAQQWLQQLN